MPECLTCKRDVPGSYQRGLCPRCDSLETSFQSLKLDGRDLAFNWAMEKALAIAGNITGVEPGSAYIQVEEDGELTLKTVERVRTTVARYVPPELQDHDGTKEE